MLSHTPPFWLCRDVRLDGPRRFVRRARARRETNGARALRPARHRPARRPMAAAAAAPDASKAGWEPTGSRRPAWMVRGPRRRCLATRRTIRVAAAASTRPSLSRSETSRGRLTRPSPPTSLPSRPADWHRAGRRRSTTSRSRVQCGNQPLNRNSFAETFRSTPAPRRAQKKRISTFGYRTGRVSTKNSRSTRSSSTKSRKTATSCVVTLPSRCAACEAGMFLNILSKFWRISSPDFDERSGTAQATSGARAPTPSSSLARDRSGKPNGASPSSLRAVPPAMRSEAARSRTVPLRKFPARTALVTARRRRRLGEESGEALRRGDRLLQDSGRGRARVRARSTKKLEENDAHVPRRPSGNSCPLGLDGASIPTLGLMLLSRRRRFRRRGNQRKRCSYDRSQVPPGQDQDRVPRLPAEKGQGDVSENLRRV